jgi:hypothetical protein
MWEETGHKTKQELINEAQTRVDRLVEIKHLMRENEAEFVLSLDSKLKTYGYGTFVSAKQIFRLRDLDERYVPDPRQQGLFQEEDS